MYTVIIYHGSIVRESIIYDMQSTSLTHHAKLIHNNACKIVDSDIDHDNITQ